MQVRMGIVVCVGFCFFCCFCKGEVLVYWFAGCWLLVSDGVSGHALALWVGVGRRMGEDGASGHALALLLLSLLLLFKVLTKVPVVQLCIHTCTKVSFYKQLLRCGLSLNKYEFFEQVFHETSTMVLHPKRTQSFMHPNADASMFSHIMSWTCKPSSHLFVTKTMK